MITRQITFKDLAELALVVEVLRSRAKGLRASADAFAMIQPRHAAVSLRAADTLATLADHIEES